VYGWDRQNAKEKRLASFPRTGEPFFAEKVKWRWGEDDQIRQFTFKPPSANLL
jgi:hypothetical protein